MFNKTRNLRVHLVLLLVMLGSVLIVTPVFAASITVNTVTDEDGTGANCSLREAITAANTDTAYGDSFSRIWLRYHYPLGLERLHAHTRQSTAYR